MSDPDALRLERAFFEAARAAWLFTAPNPRVGALAFLRGQRVGAGCHERCGGAHAEEQALRDAGAWDEGTAAPRPGAVDEIVVTLEPCSSGGPGKRRPPCVDLLLAAGVRRVVAAATDPDPRHAGGGFERLRAAGVKVAVREELAGRFHQQNGAYLDALAHPDRPWVLLKWAASFDGKTAAASGASRWISGPQSRAEVHELRAASDAILVGRRTLRLDDPELTARPGGAPRQHQPLRVVLEPDGEVAASARLFQAPGPRLWLLAEGAEPCAALEHRLRTDGDRVLFLGRDPEGRLDLAQALRALRADFGVRRLFVEGGPRLQGALLALGCADAVVRYEAPLVLGGGRSALPTAQGPDLAAAWRLVDEERADHGGDCRRAFRIVPPGTLDRP